jgi:hypothetical protein
VKPKDAYSLTDEVVLNFFSLFMADGPTVKKALSNTLHTGELNYNTKVVMEKKYGNKIKHQHKLVLKSFKFRSSSNARIEVCK